MKLFLSLSFIGLASAWDDVILSPIAGKTGPVAAVYFAQVRLYTLRYSQSNLLSYISQGADIDTDQYSSILASLQSAVSFPLWVGVPQTPFDIAAIPLGLSTGITRIQKAMVDAGMPESPDFNFYGGHSLGGAMIPDYVNDNSASADGQFLLGSFLGRKFRTGATDEGRPQVEYPVPTLTVGGELDGLCRISRITEALYNQVRNELRATPKHCMVHVYAFLTYAPFVCSFCMLLLYASLCSHRPPRSPSPVTPPLLPGTSPSRSSRA